MAEKVGFDKARQLIGERERLRRQSEADAREWEAEQGATADGGDDA